MCGNPVLWPQGQSVCRDQSKSFWLSPRSTYWHIQMPSVYCENRSIGWNNTVTGDNVPVRDDLWSSFGFTDSGAVMCIPEQLQSPLLCGCHIPLTPPRHGTFSHGFQTAVSFLPPPSCFCFSLFPTLPFKTPSLFLILRHSHLNNLHLISPRLPRVPYEPLPFYPPALRCLHWLIVSVFRSVVDISHLLS